MKKEAIGVILVAAGKSQRMNGRDKVFADLAGKPLLPRVVDILQQCERVDAIVIVLGKENLDRAQELQREHGWSKVKALCLGGERRQDSVREGLKRLGHCEWVVIHDTARPLVTAELVEKGLLEARQTGAAVAAVPVKDTIKIATPEGFVQNTPLRDTVWSVQTPQVFRFDLIQKAHDEVHTDVTDDAMMVEQLGHKVKIYMGSYRNIKITTPDDLALAEILLRKTP